MKIALIGSRPEVDQTSALDEEAMRAARRRDATRWRAIDRFVDSLDPNVVEIVSGGAPGADTWAEEASLNIFAQNIMRPRWRTRDGKLIRSGGPRRNERMAEYADRCVAFFGAGESRGTAHCVAEFRKRGKPVEEWAFAEDGTYGRRGR